MLSEIMTQFQKQILHFGRLCENSRGALRRRSGRTDKSIFNETNPIRGELSRTMNEFSHSLAERRIFPASSSKTIHPKMSHYHKRNFLDKRSSTSVDFVD